MPKAGIKKNSCAKGFALIETVLSVFMLSVGMLAIVQVFISSLSDSLDSRNQVIASALAQEGIELVRNGRDNTVTFFDYYAHEVHQTCFVSYDTALKCPNTGAVYKLYLDDNDAYTSNSTPRESRFSRRIALREINDNEIEIKSIVSWNNTYPDDTNCTAKNKCVMATDVLTDSK